jgi:sugar-specific transcriptional regulator TrmB
MSERYRVKEAMSVEGGVEALVDLGFSRLEAEVYLLLLRESPVTGYRIAQAIHRPAANVYKAIESLSAKGAVLVDDGSTRMCRAVPHAELLRQLAARFAERRSRAAKELSGVGRGPRDERIYQLGAREQVLTRTREILGRARQVVLVAAHPSLADVLAADLERTASRGVDVAIKTYRPVDIRGVEVVVSIQSEEVANSWPGMELNLVADGSEHVLALLAHQGDGVLQAVYSASLYLSVAHHNGLAAELALTSLAGRVLAGASIAELQRVIQTIRHPMDTPGAVKFLNK